MTALLWDQLGERLYQTGIDHGVLYLHDGTVVPWNGLIGIEESSTSEIKSYYLNGVKYLENLIPGEFAGKLKAFTYPEEFDAINGVSPISPGFDLYDQPVQSFNLSYRTKIGNDLSPEHGYKIHILYNVIANPDLNSFQTLNDSGAQPVEFGWLLSGTPSKFPGFRPTVHISIDSTKTPPEVMTLLEDELYGTDTRDPHLLTIAEVAGYFGYLGALIIVDHGDGSWSAIDGSDNYITMLDDTTFQIDGADVTILDPDTYEISTTNI
jgi:hypothetical protein